MLEEVFVIDIVNFDNVMGIALKKVLIKRKSQYREDMSNVALLQRSLAA